MLSMMILDALGKIGNRSNSQMIGSIENLRYCTRGSHPDLFSFDLVLLILQLSAPFVWSKHPILEDSQVNKLMRRRNLPARVTVEQEPACAVQIWPPNCTDDCASSDSPGASFY